MISYPRRVREQFIDLLKSQIRNGHNQDRNHMEKEYPACFSNIEIVFPKGENGLRNTPESCFPCFYKTECLKTAIESEQGIELMEEKVDRAYRSGMIGFLERWSQKKHLKRKKEEKK